MQHETDNANPPAAPGRWLLFSAAGHLLADVDDAARISWPGGSGRASDPRTAAALAGTGRRLVHLGVLGPLAREVSAARCTAEYMATRPMAGSWAILDCQRAEATARALETMLRTALELRAGGAL